MASIKMRKIIIRMSNFLTLFIFIIFDNLLFLSLVLSFILMILQTCPLAFDVLSLMFDVLESLALLYLIFDYCMLF